MKRGLLLIDRGSREKEAKEELEIICKTLKEKGEYLISEYCFLEVIPPYIEEGVEKCIKNKIDALTIVPYFLYPGKKVKAAVNKVMRFQSKTNVKFIVTKPMSMHNTMINLVKNRISTAMEKNNINIQSKKVDVLIIGHGSKDPNAKLSIKYVVEGLRPDYRNVDYCFLEIEKPSIEDGIQNCKKNIPGVLVIVFYFLHEGAHVKRDIYEELNPAVTKSGLKNVFITRHIGTDEKIIELIIERAKEVENAN